MGNVTAGVAAKFAFFPPDPPTYDIYRDENGRLVFPGVTADKNVDVHLLDTKGGNKIVSMFWKHPFARFTLLYSHGNAADLGQMHELFIELRAHLRVNIMRYFGIWPVVCDHRPTGFFFWSWLSSVRCGLGYWINFLVISDFFFLKKKNNFLGN
jgi:hypothetical protein